MGNVFNDFGFQNPGDVQLKAELARQICNGIRRLGLAQAQTAERLGLKQPDISKLTNGRHTGFSTGQLMALLNALEIDVEIILGPQNKTSARPGTTRALKKCSFSGEPAYPASKP
ncbi:MAG: XRE family transcriptional regulator [Planctomycetes bacterium]|nr:XRE family transcriptional regulator [Planctomycetota bacterium]